LASVSPYFQSALGQNAASKENEETDSEKEDDGDFDPNNLHLIICVHGLDGKIF
jgi:hypothetical protein